MPPLIPSWRVTLLQRRDAEHSISTARCSGRRNYQLGWAQTSNFTRPQTSGARRTLAFSRSSGRLFTY